MVTARQMQRGAWPPDINPIGFALLLTTQLSTTDQFVIIQAEYPITIMQVSITTETAVAAHDTNYWSFQVANLTQTEDLLSAAKTTKATGGAAISADTVYDLDPNQNLTLSAGDVIELQITIAASATALDMLAAHVWYHVAA